MLDTNELLQAFLKGDGHIAYVHPEDIPNIDLYMDQVTTFMDGQLAGTKRYEDDKVLTKTMINNYAKNHLLPAPQKKKYSREHLLVLIFIYYLKNMLSIKDIQRLMDPTTEKYFNKQEGISLDNIYEDICKMEKARMPDLQKNIAAMYEDAIEAFQDAPAEDREFLQLFGLISNLCFDVYAKKQLIEQLIDELPQPAAKKENKKTD